MTTAAGTELVADLMAAIPSRVARRLVRVDDRVAYDPLDPSVLLVDGEERQTTPTCWRLFAVLASDPTRTWTAIELYELLWDCAGLAHTSGALRATVRRLRDVLPDGYVVTVRSVGYRLRRAPGARGETQVVIDDDVLERILAEARDGEEAGDTIRRLLGIAA